MSYQHGVVTSESATALKPPVKSESRVPVYLFAAELNLAENQDSVNKPELLYSLTDAAKKFGFSSELDVSGKFMFNANEAIDAHFQKFGVAPIIGINVLDPAVHKTNVLDAAVSLVQDDVTISLHGIMRSSVVVKSSDGQTTHVLDTDYTLAFTTDGHLKISRVTGGAISASADLRVTYDKLDPSLITAADIIGGVDVATGEKTGLEVVSQVFPSFRIVPGVILTPGFSQDPTVRAVTLAKSRDINGVFQALIYSDVDTTDAVEYSSVPAWKNDNNYIAENEILCWPMVALGDKIYHQSTQAAALSQLVDSNHDSIPYKSISNENLQMNKACLADGTTVLLGLDEANYLNGQGICTSLNFSGGWKFWGNRTSIYPSNTDPKDAFHANKALFYFERNQLILTYWGNVDDPSNLNLIRSVVDSENTKLAGWRSAGYIVGGEIVFNEEDNPLTELIDGQIKFSIGIGFAGPAKVIWFDLHFDVSQLAALFG